MQSLFDEVVEALPLTLEYETDCRDVWPARWALLKDKVEKFNCSAQSGPTNTTQATIAINLLKRWAAQFDNDDPEFSDLHLYNETVNFINNMATIAVR